MTLEQVKRLFEGYPNYSLPVAHEVAEAIFNSTNSTVNFVNYIPTFKQVGIANPIISVKQTSFPVLPLWTRTSMGVYDCTLVGGFPIGKTYIGNQINPTGLAILSMTILNNGFKYAIYRFSNDVIRLFITDDLGNPVEWSSVFNADDIFNIPEIKVYFN